MIEWLIPEHSVADILQGVVLSTACSRTSNPANRRDS
ncbi:hypothetical protein SAMN05444745_111117 [Arthrobacter sp. OV608]|nr:hypothetical protein SAMN05444745_111117 [Arthrobacter sp. OV608]